MAAREKKATAADAKPAAGKPAASKAAASKATKTTAEAKPTTRRTTTRRKAAPAVTEAMIAERAYWISQSPECGSDVENWLRAEAELQAT